MVSYSILTIVDSDIQNLNTLGMATTDLSKETRQKLLSIRFGNLEPRFLKTKNQIVCLISLSGNMITFADTCADSGSYVYVYGFYCSSISNCHLYRRKRLTVQDF